MDFTVKKAYAKINFFLDIENKRHDGYHNIISLMQLVDWYDEIKISKNVSRETVIKSNSLNIPHNKDNIAYRATKKYLDAIGSECGITVEIQKSIPVAAGMAGGSADAAAVLLGMNELFDNALSESTLYKIGALLGADVPFCMSGGTKIVKGIGDILLPCDPFPDCYILCAKLGDGVSTPMAYGLLDKKFHDFKDTKWRKDDYENLMNGIHEQNPKTASLGFFNIFEPIVSELKPYVPYLKNRMEQNGAYACLMSGSGPSVFGLFDDKKNAEFVCAMLKEEGAMAKVCRPIKERF